MKPTPTCAYCGHSGITLESEHVIPSCLYPRSRGQQSKVQRLTVPACSSCNRGWSDDEAHFRNVLSIAGEPNAAVRELWDGPIQRSLDRSDGHRRAADLRKIMERVEIGGQERWMIYPAKDDRVLRVVRKIVRGLSHHHGLESAVTERRITADVLRYVVPPGLIDENEFLHREHDICRYWFIDDASPEVRSSWLLTFFDRLTFIAWVARE
jgi:hypothetical protein